MRGKTRSIAGLSIISAILCLAMLTAALPVGASDGALNGDGIKWKSIDLYRTPLGEDAAGNVYVLVDRPGDPAIMINPRLMSLDPHGAKRWEYQINGYGFNSLVDKDGRTYLLEYVSPDGQLGYVFGEEHILTVLDNNGTKLLSIDLSTIHDQSSYFALLSFGNEVVYYAIKSHSYPVAEETICAIGLNGTEQWSITLPGSVLSASVVAEQPEIIVASEKGAFFIDNNGTITKSVNMVDGTIIGPPILSPTGNIYVPVHHGENHMPCEIWAYNSAGEKMWERSVLSSGTYSMGSWVYDMLLSSDGTLYVALTEGIRTDAGNTELQGDISPAVLAIDQDGQILWTYQLGVEEVNSHLAELDQKILVCTRYSILVLSPEGILTDRYAPPYTNIFGMISTSGGHFYVVENKSPNVALIYSEGFPHLSIIDWLVAYLYLVVLVVVVVLVILAMVLYQHRRERAGK